MKRILFVDDEPRILQGLKRMLRPKVNEWEMVFAEGGKQALEILDQSPFDVIVSDMRMPGMDGATLLEKVCKTHPGVVRIVLSGHAEQETTLRAVPIAHQFLSKPCDTKTLGNVIERACHLSQLLTQESIRSVIHKIKGLPSQPRIYHELTRALIHPQTSLKEIGQIVEQDAAMSAKTLQLVNSAFFGLRQPVSNIQTAVSCLGINMIKILSLSVEVFHCFSTTKELSGFSLDREQEHAFLTASIAKTMFQDKQKSEDAFMAGLLHDIGKLVMAEHLPEMFQKVWTHSEKMQKPFEESEQELYQITHAEIGAYLIGVWGLPYSIVEAVAYHHCPQRVNQVEFDVLSATYVSNHLAHQIISGGHPDLDRDYLEQMAVGDRLPQWQEKAKYCVENSFRLGG